MTNKTFTFLLWVQQNANQNKTTHSSSNNNKPKPNWVQIDVRIRKIKGKLAPVICFLCFFFPPLEGEVESHSITQASLKLHKGGLETLLASCILGLQVSINVPCSFFYLPLSPFFDSSCQVSKQIQTHNQIRFYKNPQSLKLKNHNSLSSDETIETLSSK